MKRRKFLMILGLTAVVTVAGAIAWRKWHGDITKHAQKYYDSFKKLEDAPTGVLSTHTQKVLQVTTQVTLQASPQIEMSHYEDFFRWRSENLRGYKQLYEKFAAAVDREAKTIGDHDFANTDLATQQKILEKLASASSNSIFGNVDQFRIAMFDQERLLFNEYIIRQILQLFARTDALIFVGYKAWTGQPRGLSDYKQAPGKVKTESSL